MPQKMHNCRELTIDEIIADPIVTALMRADNVEPEALEWLLHMTVSPFALRSEARHLREMAKTAVDLGLKPEHLSVYQRSPELWEREALEEKLDGAPEATGEPGKFSAGDFGRLAVRAFFSAGAGLLAWSHMPVETAQ